MSALSVLDRLGQRTDRAPNALLLHGPDAARLSEESIRLAARLLCPGGDEDLACQSCRRAFSGVHPDFLRIDPEGVAIRVDRIREALTFAAGRPYEASRRVAVVSSAELLGPEAGNALLKSLEEPGAHVNWILTTTRREALLPTILSRCAAIPVPPPSRAKRRAAWLERGFSEEDSEDLALLEPEPEEAAESLVSYRTARSETAAALHSGLLGRKIPSLILLSDRLARQEGPAAQLLSELLADAAISAATSADLLRHRAVAGVTRELGQYLSAESLRRAALAAADAPPDIRRGNRRLHYEKVLLELYLAAEDQASQR